MIRRIACAALALLACFIFSAALAESREELDKQVDASFRRSDTVGGAFIVAKDGKIVYERYYGVQQKTTRVPVTEKTYFRCASVTKLVSGVGLMHLMEEGLLAPDEDISAYLGYKVRNPRYPNTPVTLRMLMSHTAGLNENSSYSVSTSLLQDMLDVSRKARSNFRDVEPGATYTYSNFGAGVTGAIVESVTGMGVSNYMRQEIFAPLGIDAAYSVTQLAEPDFICATYTKNGDLYVAPSYLLRQTYDDTADPDRHYRTTIGSLYIRPRDLARLGIALCGDGTVDGVRVLHEESLAMMREAQSKDTTGITSDSPYSFFTIRQDTLLDGRRVYGHQGTDEGIVCNLYYEPETQLVICVMTNGCNTLRDDGIMSLTRRMAALAEETFLNGDGLEDGAESDLPDEAEVGAPEAETPDEDAAQGEIVPDEQDADTVENDPQDVTEDMNREAAESFDGVVQEGILVF